eukprot:g30111.t1
MLHARQDFTSPQRTAFMTTARVSFFNSTDQHRSKTTGRATAEPQRGPYLLHSSTNHLGRGFAMHARERSKPTHTRVRTAHLKAQHVKTCYILSLHKRSTMGSCLRMELIRTERLLQARTRTNNTLGSTTQPIDDLTRKRIRAASSKHFETQAASQKILPLCKEQSGPPTSLSAFLILDSQPNTLVART